MTMPDISLRCLICKAHLTEKLKYVPKRLIDTISGSKEFMDECVFDTMAIGTYTEVFEACDFSPNDLEKEELILISLDSKIKEAMKTDGADVGCCGNMGAKPNTSCTNCGSIVAIETSECYTYHEIRFLARAVEKVFE